MNKLIVVIMGPGNEEFFPMCHESVKGADKVLYFTSNLACMKYLEGNTYYNDWNNSDKNTNGKARNVYLKHLKKNYPDDWCLVLDEDEVCEDIEKVKEFIQTAKPALYYPKMRHFIGDLGHEDYTTKDHWVPNRLFKISEAISYPIHSHPILKPKGKKCYQTNCTTIWHLGHLPVEYIKYIVKRSKEHLDNSIIHSKEFLKQWRDAHLYGKYPTKEINLIEIPKIILDNFDIDFDELYFRDRKLMEAKHYQDAIDWKDYFESKDDEPLSSLLFGCGFGQRVYALRNICNKGHGVELSEYAVKNSIIPKYVSQGNILDFNEPIGNFKLTIAYDILEHLEYKDLEKAINTLYCFSEKYILISVPFKGLPICDEDPTHIIKEDRDWWVKQFTDKGLKEVEVPSHFQYRHQLLIFEK